MSDTVSTGSPQRSFGAYFVAAGILCSRLAGLVREMIFAHYFGSSAAADALRAAIRIPNFLQNLFGEGVLSASFIPVYARLRSEGKEEEARRVAGSVASILALVTSVLVLAGIYASPLLVDLITPGFEGDKRQQVITLVQIFFPGTGLLVLSAWCLGILNSHRRFLLSYTAPILWNAAIIGAMLYFGSSHQPDQLAVKVAWGAVLGSALQFLVQLRPALRSSGRPLFRPDPAHPAVRTVLRSFFPVMIGRGVVQISAYIDNVIASFLPTGALAAFGYAQTLYLLPVSLFGMSVSAAELPELSAATKDDEGRRVVREKLSAAKDRILFFVAPTMVVFILLGDHIIGVLFESGRFSASDTRYVWYTLAAASFGLLAATSGRLHASALYALHDTKTPLYIAIVRVIISSALAYYAALYLPAYLGVPALFGIVGLSFGSMIGSTLEFLLLRRAVHVRVGKVEADYKNAAVIWFAALLSGGAAYLVTRSLPSESAIVEAAAALIPFGILYLTLCRLGGVSEVRTVTAALRRRIGR